MANADRVYFMHLQMCADSLDMADASLNSDAQLQQNIIIQANI